MSKMMPVRIPRFAVGLGACLACTTVQQISPARLSASHAPSRIWVTRADHATIELEAPSLHSDTLVGLHDGFLIRVAEADVLSVKADVVSPARTTALIVGIGAVAGYVTYLLVFKPESTGFNNSFPPGGLFASSAPDAAGGAPSVP